MDEASFRLAEPWLLALLILPLLLWWRRPGSAGAGFAPTALAAAALRPARGPGLHRLLVVLGLSLLALAAARPQYGSSVSVRTHEGRELMLVVDLSGSMRIDDIAGPDGERMDRLAAVMQAARQFIDERENDRLGLVIFAGSALHSCPITYDHQTLKEFLSRIESQQRASWQARRNLLGDGTNIGLGLGHALRGLTADDAEARNAEARNAEARNAEATDAGGRAIILITDGRDTRQLHNWVDPIEASERAADRGIRIHAIGVGNPQGTQTVRDLFGRVSERRLWPSDLPDLSRLQAIAEASDGIALAAGDRAELGRVFAAIDRLEASPEEVRQRDDYNDHFRLPLLAGLLLMSLASLAEPRLRGAL